VSDHAEERTRLLHGPYVAPSCGVGDVLICERYGESVVAEMSVGRIPWPVCRAPGRPRLVLCGDLASAVRVESETAAAGSVTRRLVPPLCRCRGGSGCGIIAASCSSLLSLIPRPP
jgi:hypothetical protein